MNIKLPYSWICDYLKTDAPADKVFKLVTASGPTIERIEKTIDDYLLDIEVTINRPDCLSVLGIAREMYTVLRQNNLKAALVGDCLSNPPKITTGKEKVPFKFLIDSQLCPRFMGVILKDIKIGPSPDFIVKRLEKAGMRSLNNVIDITNFLMLETGQPNHAFDFHKIKGPQFLIRPAKKGEKIITLDNQKRLLDVGDIIYEDEEKIFDLAGIMGGQASEIDNNTHKVFLTVVNLYYAQIRKTAMRLGIQTEASARLTKVLNPEVVEPVLLRGIELMQKYASAKVSSQIFDSYPKKQKPIIIKTTDFELDKLLGISIPEKTKDQILNDLGFSVKRIGGKVSVTAPIWRLNDISLTEDLTEEIARVYDYDKIANQPPIFELPTFSPLERKPFSLETRIRHLLVDWGFSETLSFSMLGENDLEKIYYPSKKTIKIANPLSEDWVLMQPTLVPNLLKNVSSNQYLKPNLKIFEIANTFNEKGKETRMLGLALLGNDMDHLKGIIEQLLNYLNIKDYRLAAADLNYFDKIQSAQIVIGKNIVGVFGLINSPVSSSFGLKNKVHSAELNLDSLIKLSNPIHFYKRLGKYNPIIEDLSLNLPASVSYKEVEDLIKNSEGVEEVEYKDRFENHITLRLYYQLKSGQIAGMDAQKIREGVLNSLKKKLGVELH